MLSIAKMTETPAHASYSVYLNSQNIGRLCVGVEDVNFIEGVLRPCPNADDCPAHIVESLRQYEQHGIPVGDFLHAVLCNNLRGAIGRADDKNILLLRHVVCWCYWNLMHTCWGSPDKVREHLHAKALERKADATRAESEN